MILHFLRAFVDGGVSSAATPSLFHVPLSSLVASSSAWRSQLLSALSLYYRARKQSAASTALQYQVPPFFPAMDHTHRLYSEEQREIFRGSLSGSKHP